MSDSFGTSCIKGLRLLKSNVNLQFVTDVYAMLAYLTLYLCKPEHKMKELMRKASKEAFTVKILELKLLVLVIYF